MEALLEEFLEVMLKHQEEILTEVQAIVLEVQMQREVL